MSKRTAVVVAGVLGFLFGGLLFAEQPQQPTVADTLTDARRTAQGLQNDNCADAILILDGDTDYDTSGANTDGVPHAQCEFDGQTYHDIWYNYVATCSGELTVSTCGQGNYDTDIVVYDGCQPHDWTCPPGDAELLGCNDDSPGCASWTSQLYVPVFLDNCYTIRIGGWQEGDEGSSTVTVSCELEFACGDGICQPDENCNDCPDDCGSCLFCGDGGCQAGEPVQLPLGLSRFVSLLYLFRPSLI